MIQRYRDISNLAVSGEAEQKFQYYVDDFGARLLLRAKIIAASQKDTIVMERQPRR